MEKYTGSSGLRLGRKQSNGPEKIEKGGFKYEAAFDRNDLVIVRTGGGQSGGCTERSLRDRDSSEQHHLPGRPAYAGRSSGSVWSLVARQRYWRQASGAGRCARGAGRTWRRATAYF